MYWKNHNSQLNIIYKCLCWKDFKTNCDKLLSPNSSKSECKGSKEDYSRRINKPVIKSMSRHCVIRIKTFWKNTIFFKCCLSFLLRTQSYTTY